MAERTPASPVTGDAAIEKVRLAEAAPAPQRPMPSGYAVARRLRQP
jgi:nuclear transport factor 2 (NTF2) superfamily protein